MQHESFTVSIQRVEDREWPWRVTFNFAKRGPIYGAGVKLSNALMRVMHLAGFIDDHVAARNNKVEAARQLFWDFEPGLLWYGMVSALENDW